jgi:hypothetical protein
VAYLFSYPSCCPRRQCPSHPFQQQITPLHPFRQQTTLLHPRGASTTDSTIHLAKSKAEVTAKGGVMERTVPTIITWCPGIISIAYRLLTLRHHPPRPRPQLILHHFPPTGNNHVHRTTSLKPSSRIWKISSIDTDMISYIYFSLDLI